MLLLTGVWKISHMLLNIRKRRLDATVLISCEASNTCYLSSSILHILNIHGRFFFRRFCKHRQHCAEGTLFLPGNGDNGCFPANEFETRETAGEVCKGRIYLGRIQLENGELPRNYRTRKGSLPPINITLTQWPRNYGIQTKL